MCACGDSFVGMGGTTVGSPGIRRVAGCERNILELYQNTSRDAPVASWRTSSANIAMIAIEGSKIIRSM